MMAVTRPGWITPLTSFRMQAPPARCRLRLLKLKCRRERVPRARANSLPMRCAHCWMRVMSMASSKLRAGAGAGRRPRSLATASRSASEPRRAPASDCCTMLFSRPCRMGVDSTRRCCTGGSDGGGGDDGGAPLLAGPASSTSCTCRTSPPDSEGLRHGMQGSPTVTERPWWPARRGPHPLPQSRDNNDPSPHSATAAARAAASAAPRPSSTAISCCSSVMPEGSSGGNGGRDGSCTSGGCTSGAGCSLSFSQRVDAVRFLPASSFSARKCARRLRQCRTRNTMKSNRTNTSSRPASIRPP